MRTFVAVVVVAVVVGAVLAGGCGVTEKRVAKPQSLCPVMGAPINKDLYVDADGARIYVCCTDCIAKVKADPQAALKKIVANGERAETRIVVCPKCGEVQGSKKCCVAGAEKCEKCGLDKGSLGCCKDLKPAAGQKDVVVCPKCGEVAGSDKCCKADAKRCEKCGLIADSPGCCKLMTGCPCGTMGTADACGCAH